MSAAPIGTLESLSADLDALIPEMHALLAKAVSFDSVSGHEEPLVRFLAGFAAENGLEADLWQGAEEDAARAGWTPSRHIPLDGRPTLVLRLPGRGGGRSLLFNAHSDVVPAPEPRLWRHPPFSGAIDSGRLFGRGACDTKGPLVAAVWAMLALRRIQGAVGGGGGSARLDGELLLEIVPGEEDCVGLGTWTSIARGWRADAAVVLEPTKNVPCCASRSGCRFEITATGRAVHGTVKWLGVDAIGIIHQAQSALRDLERRWNNRKADDLFAPYPIARPVTVDKVQGGRWQGMVCDQCRCAGYLELLPRDDMAGMQERFKAELIQDLTRRGVEPGRLAVEFTEVYPGHRMEPDHALCEAAHRAIVEGPGTGAKWAGWTAFNSGCEAGIRSSVSGTPTLVWGPGDLSLAHAIDESIALDDVRAAAGMFARLALRWCGNLEHA